MYDANNRYRDFAVRRTTLAKNANHRAHRGCTRVKVAERFQVAPLVWLGALALGLAWGWAQAL